MCIDFKRKTFTLAVEPAIEDWIPRAGEQITIESESYDFALGVTVVSCFPAEGETGVLILATREYPTICITKMRILLIPGRYRNPDYIAEPDVEPKCSTLSSI